MSFSKMVTKSLNHNLSSDIFLKFLRTSHPVISEYHSQYKSYESYAESINLFFDSIYKNNLDKVREFYHKYEEYFEPGISCKPLTEAALDLAERLNRFNIVKFLRNRVDPADLKPRAKSKTRAIYKRAIFNLDKNEIFHEIQVGLYRNGIVKVKFVYRTPSQHFLIDQSIRSAGMLMHVLGNDKRFSLSSHAKMSACEPIDELDDKNPEQKAIKDLLNSIDDEKKEQKFLQRFKIVWKEFDSLERGKLEHFYPQIYKIVRDFFDERNDRFPFPDCSVPQKNNPHRASYRLTNYMDFLMYDAVIKNDHETLRDLLRNGCNPNAYFHNNSIFYVALYNGVDVIQNKKHRIPVSDFSNLNEILQVLLEYGAEGENFLRDLVYLSVRQNLMKERYEESFLAVKAARDLQHCIDYDLYNAGLKKYSNARYFYRDALKFVPASEKLWKFMIEHNDFAEPIIMEAILKANQRMQEVIKRRDYVRDLEVRRDGSRKNICFTLKNESVLNIETWKVSNLNHDQYKKLKQFFLIQPDILVDEESKSEYFDREMQNNSGTTYVDIITINNELVGVYIYEYIKTLMKGKETFIYYMKLVFAKLEKYPALIKLIILLRGFASSLYGYDSISFAQVVSHHGFCLADRLKRYPTHNIPEINIEDILDAIYNQKKIKPEFHNEYCYVEDKMSVANSFNPKKENQGLVSFSFFASKAFAKRYRINRAICVAFLNDLVNFNLFMEDVLPVFGEYNVAKLFSYYEKDGREFLGSNRPNKLYFTSKPSL